MYPNNFKFDEMMTKILRQSRKSVNDINKLTTRASLTVESAVEHTSLTPGREDLYRHRHDDQRATANTSPKPVRSDVVVGKKKTPPMQGQSWGNILGEIHVISYDG